jgi:hypothetical protein
VAKFYEIFNFFTASNYSFEHEINNKNINNNNNKILLFYKSFLVYIQDRDYNQSFAMTIDKNIRQRVEVLQHIVTWFD